MEENTTVNAIKNKLGAEFEKMSAEYQKISAEVKSKVASIELDVEKEKFQQKLQPQLDQFQKGLIDLKEAGEDVSAEVIHSLEKMGREIRQQLE